MHPDILSILLNVAKDFISKLLVVDPKKRLDAKAALKHSFITKRCAPLTASPTVNQVSSRPVSVVNSPLTPSDVVFSEISGEESLFDARSIESLNSTYEEDDPVPPKNFERMDTAIGPSVTSVVPPSGPDRQTTAINIDEVVHKTAAISIKEEKLRILSYNLCIRPPFVKANSNDFKDARLQIFIDSHLANYDIVILQARLVFQSFRGLNVFL